MSVSTSFFLKRVKSNKRYKRLVTMMEKGVFSVNYMADKEEVLNMLKVRKTRTISTSDMLANFQKKMIDISLQSAAFRSRLVEIRLQYFELSENLKEHIDNMKNYLATKYAGQLKNEFATVKARSDALDHVMEDFQKAVTRFEIIMSFCDQVIADIDSSSWWAQRMVSAMELKVQGAH